MGLYLPFQEMLVERGKIVLIIPEKELQHNIDLDELRFMPSLIKDQMEAFP